MPLAIVNKGKFYCWFLQSVHQAPSRTVTVLARIVQLANTMMSTTGLNVNPAWTEQLPSQLEQLSVVGIHQE